MKSINKLFNQLKILIKYLFTKQRRPITQQVNLNIQAINSGTTKKYFCYFTDKENSITQSPLVMNNEVISLAKVTQLRTRLANTKSTKAPQAKLPMQVDTIIVSLFEKPPTEHTQPQKQSALQMHANH